MDHIAVESTQVGTATVRVLLVDDRPENLLSLEAILASPAYEMVKAHSGADALRYLLMHDCAIILLDVQMPDMDGFETADLIKANPRLKDVPIVFLTALNHDARYATRGYAIGAVDYISKPIEPDMLRAKVSVFAQLHRSKQKLIEQARQLREHERMEQQRVLAELELRTLKKEQALHRRYRDLVDGLGHAIVWVADPGALSFRFVSRSASDITGYPSATFAARPSFLLDIVPPEDAELLRRKLIATTLDAPAMCEHRLVGADGSTIWVETTARLERRIEPHPTADDGGIELRGLSVVVTDRKRTERTLRLLAAASDELSRSLEVQDVLVRAARLAAPERGDFAIVGLLADDEQGVGATSLVHHGEVDKVPAVTALAQTLAAPALDSRMALARGPFALEEVPVALWTASDERAALLRSLGVRAWFAVPLVLNGTPRGWIAVGSQRPGRPRDDAKLLVLEELARRASQAIDNALLYERARAAVALRDEFLSIASHELKTPLSPLKMQLESTRRALAQSDVVDVPRLEAKLQMAERQVDRLHGLVESLLDVSRIRAGRLELEREDFDLFALVDEVVSRLRPDLVKKGILVTVERSGEVTGRWDRARVDQVVTNLVSNALKYGSGKPVAVRIVGDDVEAVLTVADQGIGIDKRDLERIFARFERAVSEQHYGGLGLGLYIAHQIVTAHEGTIKVESTPGVGTTFTVKLPRPRR